MITNNISLPTGEDQGGAAILFDFDGTIADTAPGIVATMTETFRQMGLPIPTEEAMRQTIGIPLGPSLQHLNNLSDEQTAEAVETYTSLFMTIEVGKTRIFDGVAETIIDSFPELLEIK